MSEPSRINETAATQPPPANPLETASSADAHTLGVPASGEPGEHLAFLRRPEAADEIGRLAHYRVLKELGRGGMGCVLLAEDVKLQRQVALKVMLPQFAKDAKAKERFLREARAAAKIKHDNVVSIYQVDEDHGMPFIALEFLEGAPLDTYLKNKGALPLPLAIRIAREMADGLAAAHKQGLVHRDVKPGNIWLEAPKGRVKILDFGLARAEREDAHLTQLGAIVGTPAFMAPEQARGEKIDGRADLFSLGVVLYRLTTGKQPFVGASTVAVLTAIAVDTPPPPRSLNARISEALERIIVKLLEKDPEKRYATVREVIADLNALQNDKVEGESASVEAAVLETPERAPATDAGPVAPRVPGRRNPQLVGVTLGLLAILAAGIVLFWPTANGLVRIEINDPAVKVAIDQDEFKITGIGKHDIRLSAGKYALRVRHGASDFETDKFILNRGDTVTLKIEVLRGKVQVLHDGKVIGAREQEFAKIDDRKLADTKRLPPEPVVQQKKTDAPVTKVTPPKDEPGPLAREFTNSLGMEFVLVPKGTGWLGGGGGKPGEQKVEFDYDFYLGKYEVTQEEWEKVMGQNPSVFSRQNLGSLAVREISDAALKRFPVENVSWEDCQKFIERLNEKEKEKDTGWAYRLPTEAEWEYACRGGPVDREESAFDFYFAKPTNDLLPEQANFGRGVKELLGRPRTCKVGLYVPNGLGLHDMHGNVSEWCDAEIGAPRPPLRGGNYSLTPASLRAAEHASNVPSLRLGICGLRLARVPLGKETKSNEDNSSSKPSENTFTNSLGMEFVLVPKGAGWLGGGGGKSGEQKVEFDSDFYLGKYEVTQQEWEKVTGRNPSAFNRENPAVKNISDADLKRFPVENVSWDDCQLFIERLNETDKDTGWVYRLPTEAEWEYACRGGPVDREESAFDFYFAKPTNELLPEQANFLLTRGGRRPKVDQHPPNKLGLHNMHGNVREWCMDELTDAKGMPQRAFRGGCYVDPPVSCRAASRANVMPSYRHQMIGLRLARIPAGTQ